MRYTGFDPTWQLCHERLVSIRLHRWYTAGRMSLSDWLILSVRRHGTTANQPLHKPLKVTSSIFSRAFMNSSRRGEVFPVTVSLSPRQSATLTPAFRETFKVIKYEGTNDMEGSQVTSRDNLKDKNTRYTISRHVHFSNKKIMFYVVYHALLVMQ